MDSLNGGYMPFRVVEKAFACRDDAKMFIVVQLLSRQKLSALTVSYLRGLRYQGEKQAHGGDRRSERFQAGFATGKTAEALAEIFGVKPAVVRRDAQVTTAVNRIAMNCGKEVKCRLLARDAGLNRSVVIALARLPAEEQKAVVGRWMIAGKLGPNLAPASAENLDHLAVRSARLCTAGWQAGAVRGP